MLSSKPVLTFNLADCRCVTKLPFQIFYKKKIVCEGENLQVGEEVLAARLQPAQLSRSLISASTSVIETDVQMKYHLEDSNHLRD